MRTLSDHRVRVTELTNQILAIFADEDVEAVEIPLRGGDTIRLRRKPTPAIPSECGPELCLYWMIYVEIDRILRRYDPIEERPPE